MDRRLLTGFLLGSLITLLLVVLVLGVRADLPGAARQPSFWIKLGYTSATGCGALVLAKRLARPEWVNVTRFWPAVLPFGVLLGLSILALARTEPSKRLALWLGSTWLQCPFFILTLAMPIFIGLVWSLRRLAPTRLRHAGASAGLAAGGFGGMLYRLHCSEVSPLFVLTWYTLGMVSMAGIGAFIGPRVLRW